MTMRLAVSLSFLLNGMALLPSTLHAQPQPIVNPHGVRDACLSCHRERPVPSAPPSRPPLLGATIDATCLICHPYNCCRLYALKGHSHPSDVGKWDVEKFSPPRILPLFEGKIACTTCHLNHPGEGGGETDYRLLRMVKVYLERVDWSALCRDCHREY